MKTFSKIEKMEDFLSYHIYNNGPTEFQTKDILKQKELFYHRAALYYTHSKNLPSEWIGTGLLDVKLTIPTPDYLESREIRSYAIPRFWVDLIQQATEKIRWTPLPLAYVRITRYDLIKLRDDHFIIGAKSLRDSLKFSTNGRRDSHLLYYFGAIMDDDCASADFKYYQEIVSCKSLRGIRIQVSDRALN